MSYILDALTKSQQERREGGVPTLSTPPLALDPAKGAHARYAYGALILLAGATVLFAAQMLFRQNDGFNVPPRTAADAPAGAAPAAPAAAPDRDPGLSPTTPETVAPSTPSLRPAPPVADEPGPPPHTPSTGDIAQAARPSRPMPSPSPGPGRRGDSALTEAPIASPPRLVAPADEPLASTSSSDPAAAPPPVSSEEAAFQSAEDRLFPGAREAMHPETARLAEELLELAARPAPSVVIPDQPALPDAGSPPASPQAANPTAPSSPHGGTATAAARVDVTPAAARVPPGGEVLPGVRALPDDVQASLGRLTINAHVYDDDPSGRMVIINMNRYGEGERLREGPRVEAITVKGAVLSYQSHRFHLNAR
ncbi:MAG TPA: general secretion pathway protein GspB [Gammaproteobacteria bacterium]|nr:general secretion pathway protein GspB [Gammaproteobacteria bacterium]